MTVALPCRERSFRGAEAEEVRDRAGSRLGRIEEFRDAVVLMPTRLRIGSGTPPASCRRCRRCRRRCPPARRIDRSEVSAAPSSRRCRAIDRVQSRAIAVVIAVHLVRVVGVGELHQIAGSRPWHLTRRSGPFSTRSSLWCGKTPVRAWSPRSRISMSSRLPQA